MTAAALNDRVEDLTVARARQVLDHMSSYPFVLLVITPESCEFVTKGLDDATAVRLARVMNLLAEEA